MRERLLTVLMVGVVLAAACSDGGTDGGTGGGATTSTAPGASEGEIVALAYNVAGLPQGMSGSEPWINSVLISPLLNGFDLVLLQEDWGDPSPDDYDDPSVLEPFAAFDLFHDDIVSEATHEYQSDPAPQPLGLDASRDTALLADGLNRLSIWPFGDVTRVAWDDCEGVQDGASDCLAFKGFSVATHTIADGVEIDVYNLHAEAGGGERDQAVQVADFAQLAAFVNEHSAGRAVILGGDTNLHTGDGHPDDAGGADAVIWADFLAATGIVDVCGVVDCGEDAGRIDKFAFRSNDALELTPLDHDFLGDEFVRDDGEPLSDHEPLTVTFAWRALG